MNQVKTCDICIIGAGASGLVAAIKAAITNPEVSVVVVEKMEVPGKKVAASGNGRCNLSNIESSDWENTLAFFSSIGLFTRTDEEGRVYPYSEDGRDVVRILTKACSDRGVEIICRRSVTDVRLNESIKNEDTKSSRDGSNDYVFAVTTEFNRPRAYRPKPEDGPLDIKCKRLLIATGGKSKPKLGTTGDGYSFAKNLGHSIGALIPVLTGVKTKEDIGELGLSGIRQKATVTLFENDREVFRDLGEVQFTDYGISGICVFDMSRFIIGKDFDSYRIEIDLAPDFSEDSLSKALEDMSGSLCSIVKEPLAKVIEEGLMVEESKAYQLKHFTLHPEGLRGWDMAQVTRGGIPLSEINEATGESLVIENLYFSGEILDVDFKCGGFNLQNAWSTGLRAGESMARSIR